MSTQRLPELAVSQPEITTKCPPGAPPHWILAHTGLPALIFRSVCANVRGLGLGFAFNLPTSFRALSKYHVRLQVLGARLRLSQVPQFFTLSPSRFAILLAIRHWHHVDPGAKKRSTLTATAAQHQSLCSCDSMLKLMVGIATHITSSCWAASFRVRAWWASAPSFLPDVLFRRALSPRCLLRLCRTQAYGAP